MERSRFGTAPCRLLSQQKHAQLRGAWCVALHKDANEGALGFYEGVVTIKVCIIFKNRSPKLIINWQDSNDNNLNDNDNDNDEHGRHQYQYQMGGVRDARLEH